MEATEIAEQLCYPNGFKKISFGQFNVFELVEYCNKPTPYVRRDFYKISLITTPVKIHFADKGIEINRPALMFSNPLVPYSWEPLTTCMHGGYFCLFTEQFLNGGNRNESMQDSPLYKTGSNPIYFLDEGQVVFVTELFKKMQVEFATDYAYKYDLLRNYVNLMIHEALKMQPGTTWFKHHNAAERIATLFLELLDRQFPIDSPQTSLKLKSANDYAVNLSVHVNHLNSAVRTITGKTTTAHITDKIIHEAKALLLHTDWSVADIAYSLGFEYTTYFNNFFKKQTGQTPLSLRRLAV
jgi:AraC-like DNA-binding protein